MAETLQSLQDLKGAVGTASPVSEAPQHVQKLDSLGLSMPATPPVSGGASTTTPKAQGQERRKP